MSCLSPNIQTVVAPSAGLMAKLGLCVNKYFEGGQNRLLFRVLDRSVRIEAFSVISLY